MKKLLALMVLVVFALTSTPGAADHDDEIEDRLEFDGANDEDEGTNDYKTLVARLEIPGATVHVGYRNQQGELVNFDWIMGWGGRIVLRTQMFLAGRDEPVYAELEDFDRDGRPDVWRFFDAKTGPKEMRLPDPQGRAAIFVWDTGVGEAARLIREESDQ